MKLFFAKLLTLTFFWALSAQAATHIVINSPLDGNDLRKKTTLDLDYTIHAIDPGQNPKIVVFRYNNNLWSRVQEIPLNENIGNRIQNAIPAFHYCDDLYAIRIMSGDRTLAGAVHFYAGTGTCSSPDKNKFVNLEQNLVDLLIFKPANQMDRDTCGAFATSEALSAAYRRLKGINLTFSQQFLHHLVKSGSYSGTPFYMYENQSSLWGGNNITDGFKILKYYAAPAEVYSPYMSQGQLAELAASLGTGNMLWHPNPQINRVSQINVDTLEYNETHNSLLSRQMAMYGANQLWHWRGAEARNTMKIEAFLRSGVEVVLGLDLKWKAHPEKAKTMLYDAAAAGGGHMMLIVGYDKSDAANPYFLVKNSWGDGILRLHYDLIRNQTNSEIGVIESVREVNTFHPTRWLGAWNMKHDRWIGKLYIRRAYEMAQDRYTGYLRIGEYHHQNGQRYCAYGTFDTQAKVLKMKINFDKAIYNSYYDVKWDPTKPTVRVVAKDVCSPTASGQDFTLSMGSNVNRAAYGNTIWNGISFPAEITR